MWNFKIRMYRKSKEIYKDLNPQINDLILYIYLSFYKATDKNFKMIIKLFRLQSVSPRYTITAPTIYKENFKKTHLYVQF